MSAWLWLILIALLALPVLLRLHAGDDEPDNATVHESGTPEDEDPGGGMLAAA
jgi:hypothetical protein